MRTKKTLLFVGASPSQTENAKVRKEAEAIREALKSGGGSSTLQMPPELLGARVNELRKAFEETPPDILHIAVHGTTEGDLVLCDGNDDATTLTSELLGELIAAAGVRPQLIVVNACGSESFAKEMLEHADCVIGTTDEFPPDWGIWFSASFYRDLESAGLPWAFQKAIVDIKTNAKIGEGDHAAIDELYRVYSARVLTTDAYIIQPLGDAAARDRADNVFEQKILPACRRLQFTPRRSDELSTRRSTDPIVHSLRSSRLVLADVGSKPWDPGVMAEVGFRLANGRPIVFLADDNAELPALVEPQKTFRINQPWKDLVRLCRAALERPEAWESNYPTVEIAIDRQLDAAEYVFANEAAAQLYDVKTRHELIGKQVKDVDERVMQFMPPEHRVAFEAEQSELIWKVLTPNTSADVRARVPMWFTSHPKLNGFYLPILAQKSYTPLGTANVLRIVFVPVTDWMALDAEGTPIEPKRLPFDCVRYEVLPTDVLCIHCIGTEDCESLRLAMDAMLGRCELRYKSYEVGDDACDDIIPLSLRSKVLLLCLTSEAPPNALQTALLAVMKSRPKPIAIVHSSRLADPIQTLDSQLREMLRERHCPTFSVDLATWMSPAEKPRRDKLRDVINCMKALTRQECAVRAN